MQEFCPSCAKNGVESRIKVYQLNFEEATFMCSSEACIWPVDSQDFTCISRPVGKEWSRNWDKDAAAKYFKAEPDPLVELSAYTPPQTPGTELVGKDASVTTGAIQGSTTIVPDQVFNSSSATVDIIEQNDFEDVKIVLDFTFDNDIKNEKCKILKPKLDFSTGVKLVKESTQDHVFIKQCDKTVALNRNSIQQANCLNGTMTNETTSLVSKIESEDDKSSISILSPIKEKSRLSSKRLIKRKTNDISSFDKFDFDDIRKQKSIKMEQEQCKNEPIRKDISFKKQINFNNKVIKMEKRNEVSQRIIKKLKVESNPFDFDLDKILSGTSTNVNNITNNVELLNYNEKVIKSSDKDQIDFDSILGLTSSSKDSGVGHDMVDNSCADIELEELLAGFSDDLSTKMSYNAHNYNTCRTPIEETDENKWINSLFD